MPLCLSMCHHESTPYGRWARARCLILTLTLIYTIRQVGEGEMECEFNTDTQQLTLRLPSCSSTAMEK